MGHKNGLVVLYVDDDENDRFFFERAFEQAGLPYTLKTLRDGEEAITYLKGEGPYSKEGWALPAIMFLDLKMPKVSGFDVLEWIARRNEVKQMKVVVLSSSDLGNDIERAVRLGACDYLVKGLPNELHVVISNCCRKWLNGSA